MAAHTKRIRSAKDVAVELMARGDKAVRSNDHSALAKIATQLARRVGDPLEQQFLDLARTCTVEPLAAAGAWRWLREQVTDRIEIAGT